MTDSEARDAHHLSVLRALLAGDPLSRADRHDAFTDVAAMACDAVQGAAALVATWREPDGWSAVTREGRRLDEAGISAHGSRAVLEAVRTSGQPILTTHEVALDVDSESLRFHDVGSVLAVPLHVWDVTTPRAARRVGGCLYVHRTTAQPPFTDADVRLILDVARIAQPNLNLLEHLGRVEHDLERTRGEVAEYRERESERFRLGAFETRDPEFARHVVEPLRRIAQADRVGLLILGPSGAGKTWLAHAYHAHSPRGAGPFIVLDCGQVTSAETLSAELFGYAPNSGYSTAPARGRPGKAQLADGGTLFIDEIGACPPELQQKLLRILQNGRFAPLGTSEEVAVDVQVIAASNEDLRARVQQKRFREDLFWRVSEFTVHLPPLDRRAADVPSLARTFLTQATARYGRGEIEDLTEAADRALLVHPWSRAGNLRGLEHTLNRSVLMAPPGVRRLDAAHLQFDAPVGEAEPDELRPAPAAPAAPAMAAPSVPRVRAERLDEAALRALLERKIAAHRGVLAAIALDSEVAGAFGYPRGVMPDSTLKQWVRALALDAALADARQAGRPPLPLEAVRAAIREHGSGSAAAAALGVSRDTLVWQLRKAGLTIAEVLERG